MKTVEAKKVHNDFKKDLSKFLETYDDKLSAEEMLAVTSQIVGMMIAMQDKRKYTTVQIMELVADNIREGNEIAIASILNCKGGMQ